MRRCGRFGVRHDVDVVAGRVQVRRSRFFFVDASSLAFSFRRMPDLTRYFLLYRRFACRARRGGPRRSSGCRQP